MRAVGKSLAYAAGGDDERISNRTNPKRIEQRLNKPCSLLFPDNTTIIISCQTCSIL